MSVTPQSKSPSSSPLSRTALPLNAEMLGSLPSQLPVLAVVSLVTSRPHCINDLAFPFPPKTHKKSPHAITCFSVTQCANHSLATSTPSPHCLPLSAFGEKPTQSSWMPALLLAGVANSCLGSHYLLHLGQHRISNLHLVLGAAACPKLFLEPQPVLCVAPTKSVTNPHLSTFFPTNSPVPAPTSSSLTLYFKVKAKFIMWEDLAHSLAPLTHSSW